MAVTTPGRLGITRWSADSDAFNRSQMDDSHAALENKVAVFLTGLDTDLGSYSAATYVKSFFYATNTAVLYFSNGTSWQNLTSFGTAISTATPDVTSSSGGSAGTAARSDHVHAMPGWGVVGEMATVQTTASAGSTTKFARIDHVHVLADNSVTANKIATGGVNLSAQVAANVIGTTQIQNGAVTKEKIATDQQMPAGAIMAYAGTSAPNGWLLCDGASYAKSLYPDLWSVLSGQNYGSTTNDFNVPDLRDRLPRGAATTGTNLGATAGADTVSLTTTNLPAHSHDSGTLAVANHPDHTHTYSFTTDSKLSTHTHSFSHTHGGLLTNGSVVGGGGVFGVEFYFPPGGAANRYQDGPYSMFDGGSGPQADIGGAVLFDRSLTTTSQSTSTTGSSTDLAHTHTGSGTTTVNTPSLTHTVSGSTSSVGSGAAVSVLPKTQTVNYIIKT